MRSNLLSFCFNKKNSFNKLNLNMTTIDRLPTEVLLSIFSNVDKDSLIKCIYVCKKWQSPATEANYKEVTLHHWQILKIKALFEKRLPNQDDYFQQLKYTKKLKIENGDMTLQRSAHQSQLLMQDRNESVFNRQDFDSLLPYLENLEELGLKDCIDQDLYLNHLCA